MSELPLPGPLEDFLDHPPPPSASGALRETLLQQTTGIVRRRRRMRMLAAAGAIAAIVMVAAAIVWVRWPDATTPPAEQPIAHKETPPAPPAAKPETRDAVALEWQAFDAPPEKKTAVYRQAGDRYVEDRDDLASAVRCYGQAMRWASAQDLEVDRNDN